MFRPSYEGKQILAERNLLRLRIFHALFPENSLTPAGIAFVEEGKKQAWGVVTNILRKRSADYKIYQQVFYTKQGYAATGKNREAFERHEEFVPKIAKPILAKIREAGIAVDSAEVNVCNAGGKPVFFEVKAISQIKCLKIIQRTVTNERQRNKLIHLLQELEFVEQQL